MLRILMISLVGAACSLISQAVSAAEAISYTYDAQGRLAHVDHSGSVNNNAQTVYQFDNADNRTRVTITKANSRVVVVPINGLTVIPIPDP